MNNDLAASVKSVQPTQQTNQSDSTIFDGNETGKSESEPSSESEIKETHENPLTGIRGGAVVSTSCPDNFVVMSGSFIFFILQSLCNF